MLIKIYTRFNPKNQEQKEKNCYDQLADVCTRLALAGSLAVLMLALVQVEDVVRLSF